MRRPFAVLVALLALTVAACSSDGTSTSANGAPGTVKVRNLKYVPKTLEVKTGDTVTWEFDDGNIPHDVKGDGFESPVKTKGTWSHTFTKAGSYDYHCTIHPYMKGVVKVG